VVDGVHVVDAVLHDAPQRLEALERAHGRHRVALRCMPGGGGGAGRAGYAEGALRPLNEPMAGTVLPCVACRGEGGVQGVMDMLRES